MKLRFLMPAAMLAIGPHSGVADDAGLQRCRAIAEAAARLACYDALALPARPGPRAAPAPANPAPAPASPAPAQPSAADRFGMESKGLPAPADRIESRIRGRFEGWRANSLIRLENGQVWQVADNSWLRGEWDDPKVTVRRGLLGSFYLDIEGLTLSPRVRRVQ